jgi:hypothetical protein
MKRYTVTLLINKIDGCIAATRLSLRDLSGDEPKECK